MLLLLFALVVAQPEMAEKPPIDPVLEPALRLLRSHLEWHPPAAPPERREGIRELRQEVEKFAHSGPWQAAMGAPPTWYDDIPHNLIARVEKLAKAHADQPKVPELSAYPWRLKDPQHADVKKALALLDAVKADGSRDQARRWAAEIGRNNTVVTLDVRGAYLANKTAQVVLDVRNADRATVRLYRLTTAEDLLRVLDRVGTDFIFQAHALEVERKRGKRAIDIMKRVETLRKAEELLLPEALKDRPLATWPLALDRLRRLDPSELRDRHDRDDFDELDDGRYGDDCEEFGPRLQRDYLDRENGFSTWRAGMVLDIPAEHLAKPGAYLIQVEANGQTALAPLVVEPPAVTLRRCPDGVFAFLSEPGGLKPLAGATLHARKQKEAATSNADGAAFLRVFARGDRAIVIEHQGRFAVAGFGAVFEGIYHDPEIDHLQRERADFKREARAKSSEGLLYLDGLVIALWTDRPVYRPGETVQGKLIVRKRVQQPGGASFRADEYEQGKLECLAEGTEVRWSLYGPAQGELPEGSWKLNDFGSACGSFALPASAEPGEFGLRADVDGQRYLVPHVLAVDPLHRLPVEVAFTGLPEKLSAGAKLALTVSAKYPGGLPVARGSVTLALTNETMRWNLTPDALELDHQGQVKATLALPLHLPNGRLTLRAVVNDASGIPTTRTMSVTIDAGRTPLLGGLPSLVRVDTLPSWGTDATEIELEQGRRGRDGIEYKFSRIAVANKRAYVKFPGPGWWSVRAGEEEKDVFVFGGKEAPWTTFTRRQQQADADDGGEWVDLAHYEEQEGYGSRYDNRPPLLARFIDREGTVGGKVRVLVYVPADAARLLLTIEGHSVLDYWTTPLDGKAGHYHLLQIPLRERHRPHFYLQGTILHAKNDDGEQRQDRARKALEKERREDGEDPEWCKIFVRGGPAPGGVRVEVHTDRPEYEAGEPVTVTILTRDAQGQPLATEVALSAVDQRIFATEEDRVGAVLAAFSRARGPERFQRKTWRSSVGVVAEAGERQRKQLDRQMAKAVELAAQRADREGQLERAVWLSRVPAGEWPIAVMPLGPPRQPGHETAHWSPQIRTDAQGRATVRFPAPAHLSRYRLTALALAQSGQLGVGTTAFRSGKPIEVEVLLPREVVLGTTIEVPIQVRNFTNNPHRLNVTITPQGLDFPPNAPRPEMVEVGARGAATVRVRLDVRKEGVASLKVRIDGPGHDDTETRTTKIVPPKPEAEAGERPPVERQ